jgi:hypothetical protein
MEALTPEMFMEKYLGVGPEEVELPPEFEELKGSAREISEEEKKRRREELENMGSEDLDEVFGLD